MQKISIVTIIFILSISGVLGGAIADLFFQKCVYADSGPNDIVARSVNIVDKNGKSRAGIGLENGHPIFYLSDEKGNVRAYIALASGGPQLVFRDKNGKMQLFLKSDNDGASLIGLTKDIKNQRLTIAYSPDQGPVLGLFDENNVGKAVIAVTHGDPSITLAERDKKPAIALFNKKGKGSYLSIWNDKHEPAVSLAVKGDKPGLFMYQQPRTGLLFNTAGGRPALALMNNGTPVWSATGDTPPALDMPLSDDLLNELTR